jgi:hypothetical protein
MPLYAADLTKLAKPVKKNVQNDLDEKPKRKLSETQKANLEKGRAKLKKQLPTPEPSQESEIESEVKPRKQKRKAERIQESIPEPIPEPVPEPVQKPKRKKKVEPIPKPISEPIPEPIPEPVKVRTPRKVRDPSIPPIWFEKYIQGVKKEEALAKTEKVPAKVVKQEAQEVAQKSWDNGLTRDRVSNEVDNHMTRMYSMIFNRKC